MNIPVVRIFHKTQEQVRYCEKIEYYGSKAMIKSEAKIGYEELSHVFL